MATTPDDVVLWGLNPAPGDNVQRMLHAGEAWTGQPYVLIDDSGIEICAGTSDRPDGGLTVDSTLGTQVSGPFSMSAMPQEISMAGGYYRLNPMLLSCIGSSAALPIPVLVWSTPKVLQSSSDLTSIGAGVGV